MVERVERRVSYTAVPESDFLVGDMPQEVVDATDTILAGMITRRGFKWIHGGGAGQHDGLAEHITDRFREIAPQCNPATCEMHVEVQAYDGSGIKTNLSLECPRINQAKRKDAQTLEERCLANHVATKEAFAAYVTSTAAQVADATIRLLAAQEQVAAENRTLDDLL